MVHVIWLRLFTKSYCVIITAMLVYACVEHEGESKRLPLVMNYSMKEMQDLQPVVLKPL